MKKNTLFLILGLAIGALLMSFIDKKRQTGGTRYIQLTEDFTLDNGSLLKKGTFIKPDMAAAEGYTRYILYINYKGHQGVGQKDYDKENYVKPYWIYRADSTK